LVSTPALDLRWKTDADAPALRELLYAALDDFDPTAIHDDDAENGWRVFFKDAALRDRAAAALQNTFGDQLDELRIADVRHEDWARRSQSHLHAVRVGRIIVAPPWDIPSPESDPAPESDPVASGFSRKFPIVVVIDPSTGFGTGHHETTRLCLALLQAVDLTGVRMIDVGTGSGVLAIAASRLGARDVVALDDDPDALENAAVNLTLNGVSDAVSLVRTDLAQFHAQPARVVTANLTGAVLQRQAAALRALVANGGALIVSGFSPDESAAVVAAFNATVERALHEGDWAAAVLTFPEARS
jgi:ribosomal protein L11 methyltransferase